jgi:hypothetical protein
LKYSNLAQQVRVRVASLYYAARQAPSSGSQPTSPGTIDSAAPSIAGDSTAHNSTGDEEAALLGDGGLAGGPAAAAGTLRPIMQGISGSSITFVRIFLNPVFEGSRNARLSLNADVATSKNFERLLESLGRFVKTADKVADACVLRLGATSAGEGCN